MVGVNRILQGLSVPNVMGDRKLTKEQEKDLRRKYVLRALEILQMDIKDRQIFTIDGFA
jgi:glycine/betaine/sarcosine/D-proline reductase family selenoprotein B